MKSASHSVREFAAAATNVLLRFYFIGNRRSDFQSVLEQQAVANGEDEIVESHEGKFFTAVVRFTAFMGMQASSLEKKKEYDDDHDDDDDDDDDDWKPGWPIAVASCR